MSKKIEAGQVEGTEYLRLLGGDTDHRPDIWDWAGLSLLGFGDGWAEIAYDPRSDHRNTVGTVHGGVYGVLLDTAMGCALFTRMPAGLRLATMTFTVHLVRPILAEHERIRVRGEISHLGRRQATARGEIFDLSDRLLGHGSGSFFLVETGARAEAEPVADRNDTDK